MRPRSRTLRRRGMALILAMWMSILLAMLVGSLAWQMHMEAELSSQQRKRFHCEQIARSGIQWGLFVLRKSTNPPVEGDDRYDEAQLIEVPMVVGQYHLVAFTLRSLRIQPEGAGTPIPGRAS